jgi:phenylpropionate dioxygenase-like ring-hydroxylating dioxygenase large terminal subunit
MSKPAADFDTKARFEGTSYQDILDQDTRQVPANLRAQAAPYLGCEPIPVANYTSQERFDQEAEKMWLRAWQMACREEEIPNVGDYLTYEIVDKSIIVVRSAEDRIQAFYNTCLHRGRKLATQPGRKNQFRCPFHGFTWNIDGSFKEHPFPWDFQHLTDADLQLPELRLGTWGGFVFVSFSDTGPELMDVLGPLPEHFAHLHLEKKYIAFHVAKVVKASWKAVSEAFMESHHSIDTHPQILPYLSDLNSQYDVFSDYITRQISAGAVASPHLKEQPTEQTIADEFFAQVGIPAGQLQVPEGMTARAFTAQVMRDNLSAADGNDYEHFSDAEMLDAILYNCFPNLSVWGGITNNLVYRWRPNGNDVHSSIMEVYGLSFVPKNGERPKAAPIHWLSEEETWADASEMTELGAVLDQDMGNLPYVQEGLRASGNNQVQFANYQEMRLRQHHIMMERYLNDDI